MKTSTKKAIKGFALGSASKAEIEFELLDRAIKEGETMVTTVPPAVIRRCSHASARRVGVARKRGSQSRGYIGLTKLELQFAASIIGAELFVLGTAALIWLLLAM